MTVTHVDTAVSLSPGSQQTFTLDLPDGYSAGDLLIVTLGINNAGGELDSVPAGWSQLGATEVGSSHAAALLHKRATGSEGSTLSVTLNGFLRWVAAATAYTGVKESGSGLGDTSVATSQGTGATSGTIDSTAASSAADLSVVGRTGQWPNNVSGWELGGRGSISPQGSIGSYYDENVGAAGSTVGPVALSNASFSSWTVWLLEVLQEPPPSTLSPLELQAAPAVPQWLGTDAEGPWRAREGTPVWRAQGGP